MPLGAVEVGTSEIEGPGGPAYGNLVYDEECSDIRPREVKNFVSAGDDAFGVTLSTSVAVCDYKDPTTSPVAYPVLQPILLASRRSCHGEGDWFLQEGDHHYRFSLTARGPGWRSGYRQGIQPDESPDRPGGSGGRRRRFPSGHDVLPLALRPEYPGQHAQEGRGRLPHPPRLRHRGEGRRGAPQPLLPAQSLESVNIIEEAPKGLKPAKDGFVLKVGHHAVDTFRLVPEGKRQ